MDVGGLQSVGALHRLALPALVLSAFVPLKRRYAASVSRDREQRMLRRLYRYTMCSLRTRHWLGQRWPVRASALNGCRLLALRLCMREAGLLVLESLTFGFPLVCLVCSIAISPSFRIVCKVGGTSVGLRGKGNSASRSPGSG